MPDLNPPANGDHVDQLARIARIARITHGVRHRGHRCSQEPTKLDREVARAILDDGWTRIEPATEDGVPHVETAVAALEAARL